MYSGRKCDDKSDDNWEIVLHITPFFWLPSNWFCIKCSQCLPEVCVQTKAQSFGGSLEGQFGCFVIAKILQIQFTLVCTSHSETYLLPGRNICCLEHKGKKSVKNTIKFGLQKQRHKRFGLSIHIKDLYLALCVVLFMFQVAQIFFFKNMYLWIQWRFS